MQRSLLILVLSLAATAAGAQDGPAATKAAKRQEAVEAARAPKLAEGNPLPKPVAKTTPEERRAARAARRPDGAAQARTHKVGEGNPLPQATAKVPREDRAQARATRKAESRRANKAGELTSRGEASY